MPIKGTRRSRSQSGFVGLEVYIIGEHYLRKRVQIINIKTGDRALKRICAGEKSQSLGLISLSVNLSVYMSRFTAMLWAQWGVEIF